MKVPRQLETTPDAEAAAGALPVNLSLTRSDDRVRGRGGGNELGRHYVILSAKAAAWPGAARWLSARPAPRRLDEAMCTMFVRS